ncbi:uncharacterized protein ACDP82_020320 isoform 1-T1 [Pangshura tecta]
MASALTVLLLGCWLAGHSGVWGGRPDFTHANITRLVLGAAVLLVLGLILAEAYYSRPRGGALGAWIRPSGEENLPTGRAASPQGAETPAQPPLLSNTPAPENPPQQLPI